MVPQQRVEGRCHPALGRPCNQKQTLLQSRTGSQLLVLIARQANLVEPERTLLRDLPQPHLLAGSGARSDELPIGILLLLARSELAFLGLPLLVDIQITHALDEADEIGCT